MKLLFYYIHNSGKRRFINSDTTEVLDNAKDGIGGTMTPSFCFVAGTAVLTAAGHRAIEDVQIDLIPTASFSAPLPFS